MIKASSITLLRQCIQNQNPSLIRLVDDDMFLTLSEEQYHELREVVCDELVQAGFIGEEITPYGLELEALIDYLGQFVM